MAKIGRIGLIMAAQQGTKGPKEPKIDTPPDVTPSGGPPQDEIAIVRGALNIEEADDAKREKVRHDLREPYRTLLGHFRHEIGHYYWDRLIAGSVWHEPYRELFGDERADYAAALKANYEKGPPPDWAKRHISSYASTHPWEDWAESWAHYLHLFDSLDTAIGFGFTGANVEIEVEQFSVADLYAPDHPDAERILSLVNAGVLLTTVLNELAHSMGQPDFYPFEVSRAVLRKLHFIHLVVNDDQHYAVLTQSGQAAT